MKNSNKRVGRLAGLLIIFGIIAGVLSIVPSVESIDFIVKVYPNKNQVLRGALFQFFHSISIY